ncbi:hypothetical protein GQ53DRAFT_803342 [Thozetella sp. PMI_491]|nr:hypothetical protein GQ53DRAFT_803342 [Thozetella sp. PMI_491]
MVIINVYDDLTQLLPENTKIDCLALAKEQPAAFRSVLLTAASHYALKAGGLHEYEATYRFHMGECLLNLREWINALDGSSKTMLRAVQFVASLCIIEVQVKNFDAANAHLLGLYNLLDFWDSQLKLGDITVEEHTRTLESIEHIVLLADKFAAGSLVTSQINPRQARHLPQIKAGQNAEDQRLQAISLSPYIITTTDNLGPNGTQQRPGSLFIDRMALTILGGYIFYRLLELRALDRGDDIESQVARRRLLIVKRDIERTEADMKAGRSSRELWLWEAFISFMILDDIEIHSPNYLRLGFGVDAFYELHGQFARAIQTWARVTGVTEWACAKKALVAVVWPEQQRLEARAEHLWNELVEQLD